MDRAFGLLALVTLAHCSRASDDCTCLVENNAERRTLACGETACVAGLTLACVDQEQSVARGPCNDVPVPPTPTSAPPSATVTPVDTSCDDLRTFCSVGCSRPPATAADCQTVASSGDPRTCASWQLTNGVLCRP